MASKSTSNLINADNGLQASTASASNLLNVSGAAGAAKQASNVASLNNANLLMTTNMEVNFNCNLEITKCFRTHFSVSRLPEPALLYIDSSFIVRNAFVISFMKQTNPFTAALS